MLEVYTVHTDFFKHNTKCGLRIVKRKVLKMGAKYLTLSGWARQADTVKMPADQCYSSLEAAKIGLAVESEKLVKHLEDRIAELRGEPKVDVSYACRKDELPPAEGATISIAPTPESA